MMLLSRISKILSSTKNVSCTRYYSKDNPFQKTWKVLTNEILKEKPRFYPAHADVVIIGGGFIGSSVAYWLKKKAGEGLSIVVLDKDITFQSVQKNMTMSHLTQHFSLPENIYLSQNSVEFLRNFKQNVENDIDIGFQPCGHVVLACEQYADKMEENVTIQREYGVKTELLSPEELKRLYPWLNVNDIKLGAKCIEAEGLFNPWHLLQGLVKYGQDNGTTYVNAEVTGFELENQKDLLMEGVKPGSFERINRVIYKTPDNEEHEIKFAACILAAGTNSGLLSKKAKIGTGEGLLSIPLPVDTREHKVYNVEQSTNSLGLNMPILMDTSGLWLRRNGLDNSIICGQTPVKEDKDIPDDVFVNTIVQPSLYNRIPHCKDSKINKHQVEEYDCNTYDHTGILGPHPYHNNLFIATGFGKLGCVHAPGIGKAISELIIDSNFTTVDLTRFGFDRILMDQPLVEFNVY